MIVLAEDHFADLTDAQLEALSRVERVEKIERQRREEAHAEAQRLAAGVRQIIADFKRSIR